ncbi:conserved hypothetical protein [uncultured Desulfobacterium sp.]|uniref:Uncharacterized protein n=1 Tax=uncultured Desulfobacterium sp. TaxID=201089 RepID=A0A445N041_9BACT|nr:conserved hypothetical protein [uncultured Desulfobacterium sp.]
MTDTQPIVLFPHTNITPANLKKITHRFGVLTICQPWFVQGNMWMEEIDSASIQIAYPPTRLKPDEDFKRLISEYKSWMRQNMDKGYSSMLSASEGILQPGESGWEIRKMIASAGKDSHDSIEYQAIKWHIILHLARDFEEDSLGAEEILDRLKDRRSPLEGALEDDTDRHLFEDAPIMTTRLHIPEYPLGQLFEAWFGLFGDNLSDNASLITLDPNVINHARDLLVPDQFIVRKEANGSFSGSDPDETGFSVIQLPKANDADMARSEVIKGLSGKTIILMEG